MLAQDAVTSDDYNEVVEAYSEAARYARARGAPEEARRHEALARKYMVKRQEALDDEGFTQSQYTQRLKEQRVIGHEAKAKKLRKGMVVAPLRFIPGYPLGLSRDARCVVRKVSAGRVLLERDDGREGAWWVDACDVRVWGFTVNRGDDCDTDVKVAALEKLKKWEVTL
jgi:hypothetical protein